jgi:regulator of sigma E protease
VTSKVGEELGFKTGDKIIAIDGETVSRFNEVPNKLLFAKNVTLARDGAQQTIDLPIDLIKKVMGGEKRPFIGWREPFAVGLVDDKSANKNNLKPKDIVLRMGEQSTPYMDQVIAYAEAHKGQIVSAVILRNELETPVNIKINAQGKIGVHQAHLSVESLQKLGIYQFTEQHYSFFESIPVGLQKGKDQVLGYGKQLKAIFNPETGAYKGVGGFKAIFDIFPKTWSWEVFWSITAILSIMLGVMNLLPIPALDGGHVVFLLYELVSGKKPSDKFLENAQMVGFVMLITLLVFANGNDIYKAIVGK